MRRFVTKPNSRFDDITLWVLNILSTIHFSCWIVGQFKDMANDYWFIWLPTIIAFCVINFYGTCCLYSLKYDKDFVEMRLKEKVANFLTDIPGYYDIPKACKLIDEICNTTIVPIEERKFLYDEMCKIWTVWGGGSIYKVYSVPGFITEKWKRAIIEYKKYEIEND